MLLFLKKCCSETSAAGQLPLKKLMLRSPKNLTTNHTKNTNFLSEIPALFVISPAQAGSWCGQTCGLLW
jgi:hypothetical protein